jgi:hypothetical protein
MDTARKMTQMKINRIKVLPEELTDWTGYEFKSWIENQMDAKCTTFHISLNKNNAQIIIDLFHKVRSKSINLDKYSSWIRDLKILFLKTIFVFNQKND